MDVHFLARRSGRVAAALLLLSATASYALPPKRICDLPADGAPADSDRLEVSKGVCAASKYTTRGALRAGLVPTSRTVSCTAPLLCGGAASTDLSEDFTLSITGSAFFSFTTFATSSGTSPVADTSGDTLTLTGTAPIVVTGNSSTDTITLSVNSSSTSQLGAIQLGGVLGGTSTSQTLTSSAVNSLGGLSVSGGALSFDYSLSTGGNPALAANQCLFSSSGIICEGSVADNFEGQLAVNTLTSDRSWTLPDQTGTLITSGDSGTVGDAMLAAGYSGTGSCTNQFVRGLTRNAAPTCAAVSLSADVTGSLPFSSLSGTATAAQTPLCVLLAGASGGQTVNGDTAAGGNLKLVSTANATKGLVQASANASALPAPISTGTVLQVGGADTANAAIHIVSFGGSPLIYETRANGTAASPSVVLSGNAIGGIQAGGRGSTAYTAGKANINLVAAQDWTDSNQGTKIALQTTPLNSTSQRTVWTVDDAGHEVVSGTVPSAVSCTGTGTGASASVTGTDRAFTVSISTGTSPTSSGTCTITYGTAYANASPLVCMLVDGASAWGLESVVRQSTASASAPVLTWANVSGFALTNLTASSSAGYKISCSQLGI